MAEMDLKTMTNIRDLFGLSHDLIAQSSHAGHLAVKIAETLAFLKFQYEDFDRRVKAVEAAATKPTFTESLKDKIAASQLPSQPLPTPPLEVVAPVDQSSI